MNHSNRPVAIYKDIAEFFKFGADLNRELPIEIREAAESGWDAELVERIRLEVRRYFRTASKIANWLTLITCAPLACFILYLVLGHPNKIVAFAYSVLVAAVGALAVLLLGALVGTARSIHDLPNAIYRELMGPLWRNLDILFIAISIDLFAYVFPVWDILTTYPILILLALLWLFAPWAIYVARKDVVFIKIRIGQLVLLILAAFICAASPVPMSHFQWGARRELVKKLRPFEQTEITAQWRSLDWFTQEGDPRVWYSTNAEGGYRLFSTPGTDSQSNEPLLAVRDKATKEKIITRFKEEETAEWKKVELAQQRRMAAVQAEAEREKAEALARAERERIEIRERLIHEYISNGIKPRVGHRTALVVLDGEDQETSKLAPHLSKILGDAGVQTENPIFTSAFVKSLDFQNIVEGKVMPDRQFHSEDYAFRLLLIEASETAGRARPDGITEMETDDLVWVVKLISPSDGRVEFRNEIRAKGIGFKDADAQHLARERAESQLMKIAPAILPLL
jgi:hypothetical protein